MVADNLLQYDPTDWTMLKKRVHDVFYEYEMEKRNNPGTDIGPFPFRPVPYAKMPTHVFPITRSLNCMTSETNQVAYNSFQSTPQAQVCRCKEMKLHIQCILMHL